MKRFNGFLFSILFLLLFSSLADAQLRADSSGLVYNFRCTATDLSGFEACGSGGVSVVSDHLRADNSRVVLNIRCVAADLSGFESCGGGSGAFGETSLADLVNNQILWDSSGASKTLTFGLSGASDPVLTFSNGVMNLSTGAFQVGGVVVPTISSVSTLMGKTLAAADNVIEADTGDSATLFFPSGTIEAARLPNLNTVATGLTASRCVETDGSSVLTSSAAACALQGSDFAADAGANDTYTATLSPSPGSYTTGAHYRFKANTANTEAASINFNSIGAVALVKNQGAITTTLSTGDICAGQWIDFVYDGTNAQIVSPLCSLTALGDSSGNATSAADEAYDATGWDGDAAPPQKDDVRDQFEAEPAATRTFTNKTIDAEGTGNLITIPYYWDLDLVGVAGGTASHIWNDDPLSTACTPLAVTGTNRTTGVCTFPDSDGDYGRQITRFLPTGWTGAVDAEIWWRTTGSGNARFQFQTICYADDEADDASFNVASVVTAAAGTSGRPNKQTITGITTTGCAAGELMRIRVYRNRTEGSDSLNAALDVEKVVFIVRIAH